MFSERAPGLAAGIVLAAAFCGFSCSRCGETPSAPDAQAGAGAAPPTSGRNDAAAPIPTESAALSDAAPPLGDASGGTKVPDGDAGPSACRLAYGPAEQTFRGPAAIVVAPNELRLVANDTGKPRIFNVPFAAPPPATAAAIVPPSPSSFIAMRSTPCEVAGRFVYCPANGSVYRTTLGATDTKVVAKNQPSTRISASPLGEGHAVVATLDARRTTEGVMMQAFITLDDGETVRLSEDGAGSTVLRLVQRGDKAVALYLDARTSMVPVHARPLSFEKNQLALGEDAVVYVGGPPERGVELTGAAFGSSLFAIVPLPKDSADFGMAAIPIAERPKEDVQPTWSLYPNGLDPAPVAATVFAHPAVDGGATSAFVARVRPAERMAGAQRVIELGRLDAVGAFSSLGVISTGKHVTDMAIATDAFGAVWILYGDSSATWLERRVCP